MQLKTRIFFLIITLIFTGFCETFAQKRNVGIGTSTPHPSAALHLGDDRGKGFKIPYTDSNAVYAFANATTPPTPIANGLLIFQKGAETFYYYDAKKGKWIPLSGITGPTGPTGDTGVVGPTGPTGAYSVMRHGQGPPIPVPGDTCDHYYIDVDNANIYRYDCIFGSWQNIDGPNLSKIRGGFTMHFTASQKIVAPGLVLDKFSDWFVIMSATVPNKAGYKTSAFIRAWGSAKKTAPNNNYQYADFDFFQPLVSTLPMGLDQTISLAPNGPPPDSAYDVVRWSIATAMLNPGTIQVVGRHRTRNFDALTDIILADVPGTDNEAHMEIIVIYERL